MQQMKYFGVIKVNKLNISSWINHIKHNVEQKRTDKRVYTVCFYSHRV